MTEENTIPEQGSRRSWSQSANVGRHQRYPHTTENIPLERQPRPTGVCLADVQVSPKTPEGRPPDATSPRSWSQSAKVGRHHEAGMRTEDIPLERQPRPTGVCLADVQVSPKTPEGRPPDATSPRSWSQSAKVGRHHEAGMRTEDIPLERQPRPTGVCLADVQVSPKTPEGRPPDATSPRSWSQSAKVGRQ